MVTTMLLAVMSSLSLPLSAQSLIQRADSMLTRKYHKGDIDTAYIMRPKTKWTVTARMNVSGATIESEGMEEGRHFRSEIEANRKATLSVGVSYLGFTLSAALNPAKLIGKYHDYELNFNSYGRRFGFDIIYQDAKNFTGWYDQEGMERITLPDGLLSVKTLNLNAFYVFNSRRKLKMTNIGLGAGYGYNYVPGRGWLLHISALPTFIVYSNTSMTFSNDRVPLHYHFPEVIITSRGAVVRQWSNKFIGLSMVFNFTNIGNEESLAIHNTKWRVRTFFGLRL